MSEPTEQTTHVHVHLNREKVGGAIVEAKRSNEARSFMPVAPAEAGGVLAMPRTLPTGVYPKLRIE
jgi:hypothetical protein